MYIEYFNIATFFLFGLILGSFFNVVGLRVPVKESIVTPPSHCPNCNKRIKAYDLIPVISYVILGGKCRYCKEKVSVLYPIMELATGVLFAIALLVVGWSKELFIAIPFLSLCIIIFVSDLKYMLIPDKILLVFGVYFVTIRLFIVPTDPWWDALLGAIVGFTILFIIALISNGGMGGGDIKFFALLGLIVGWVGVILILVFASFLGAVIGGAAMLMKKVKRGQPIPFGPFIITAAIITYFYGETILQWYLNFL